MIDQVARAICEAEGFGWESLLGTDETEYRQRKYRGLARAAIAAMREPTDAMKHAGAVYDRMGSAPDVARTSWINMIDAALIDK